MVYTFFEKKTRSGVEVNEHLAEELHKPVKDKKGKTIYNAFIEIVNESSRKPNKLWVDQGGEFYNNLMQEWLDINDILMYSTYSEGKSVIAEGFIKILKTKIYQKW